MWILGTGCSRSAKLILCFGSWWKVCACIMLFTQKLCTSALCFFLILNVLVRQLCNYFFFFVLFPADWWRDLGFKQPSTKTDNSICELAGDAMQLKVLLRRKYMAFVEDTSGRWGQICSRLRSASTCVHFYILVNELVAPWVVKGEPRWKILHTVISSRQQMTAGEANGPECKHRW